MLRSRIATILTTLALAGGSGPFCADVTAQELTVDIQNGPGTDFTQIQDAIDAAVPGTVIRIRSGLYQPIRIDKGLHVVGEQGVTVQNLGGQGPIGLLIEQVPAGDFVTLSDLLFLGQFGEVARNNAGVISMKSVVMEWATLRTSTSVFFSDCIGPLTLIDTTASLQGQGSTLSPNNLANYSLELQRSSVTVVDSFLSGDIVNGGPAIQMDQSKLTVTLSFGVIESTGPALEPAIRGAGVVRVAPGSSIAAPVGVTPIQGPSVTTVETLALELDVFSLGGPIDVSVRGLPGTPQLLLLGRPRAPLSVPGVSGFLHLDTLDVIASGPLSPTGSLFVTFNTPPNQAALIGVDFGFQALSLDSAGALHWSNAELSLLR